MATKKSQCGKLKLNVQHEYITLTTPNGNFTTSYRGNKSTGKLSDHFKAFCDYMDNHGHKTTGEAMEALLNPSKLAELFPGWDTPVPVNDFKEGEEVRFTHPLFIKDYPSGGTVKSIAKKYVYLTLKDGKHAGKTIGFDYTGLTRA